MTDLALVEPLPDLKLWTRTDYDDRDVITEVFEWDAYQVGQSPGSMNGMVVIDLGANIGAFSALAAWMGARHVYAVEPQPQNLEMLRMNAEPWDPIHVIEKAVGATHGMVKIAGEQGQAHTVGLREQEEVIYDVEQITLAELMDGIGLKSVDVMKADCEGAEMGAIVATDYEHLRRIDRIVMEWHGTMFHHGETDIPTIGTLVDHLLLTHSMRNIGGPPDRWGSLFAKRYPSAT